MFLLCLGFASELLADAESVSHLEIRFEVVWKGWDLQVTRPGDRNAEEREKEVHADEARGKQVSRWLQHRSAR